ncbi:alpha-glucan water dikinase [Cymbomonas tetramitiformis]|uniref:Alpha-glucan water dikinase n=1 Tax=Cymbomonas tetramitiformis TaxID=36881 RepID=A0AAE0BIU9_9CHLO|nr:alpha-glucan water dikinase [Cymbomonas tetramitiformis]
MNKVGAIRSSLPFGRLAPQHGASCQPSRKRHSTPSLHPRIVSWKVGTTGLAPIKLQKRTGLGRTGVQVCFARQSAPADAQRHSKYRLASGDILQVEVSRDKDFFLVSLSSTSQGKNILHWGLEYQFQDGWQFPPAEFQPQGTRNYNDRALQTPWIPAQGAGQTLLIRVPVKPNLMALNFVIKDESNGQWYDLNGTNWCVPLNLEPEEAVANVAPVSANNTIPTDLQGLWAYRLWEESGSPDRSQESANQEFEQSKVQLQRYVAAGYTIAELWESAKSTGVPFPPSVPRFDSNVVPFSSAAAGSAQAPVAPPQRALPSLPEDAPELCSLKAYLMWESAGRPDRSEEESEMEYQKGIRDLEAQLSAGLTLEEIEKQLRAPKPTTAPQPSSQSTLQPPAEPAHTAPAPAKSTLPIHKPPAPQVQAAPAPPPAPVPVAPPPPPQSKLPKLPDDAPELCALKAYLMWEDAGRPDRSEVRIPPPACCHLQRDLFSARTACLCRNRLLLR